MTHKLLELHSIAIKKFDIEEKIKETLINNFQDINRLHDWQLEAIKESLSNKDVLIIMPKGAGKTLTF